MNRRSLLLLLALPLLASTSAGGQARRAEVNPLLEPLLSRPTATIPESLRGAAAGFQGRHTLPGRGEALHLILRTSARREELEAMGIEVRTLRAGLATVTVAPADLAALAARGDVSQILLPQVVRPNLKKAIPDIGVAPIRSQTNGTFTGKTGKNVIVGVVDSGIDYDHPSFLLPGGGTRLLYVWDQQNNPSGALGIKPLPFNYGTEWNAADLQAGIATEQDDVAAHGHGTHVTGIAAGNGAAADENGAFYASAGVAPESQIIFVKTDFSSDGIIDAMEYIFAKATALGLPAVINLSLGTDLGSHSGTNPMEDSIDALVKAQAGRAVVVAAGNSRGDKIHADVAVTQGGTSSVTFQLPNYSKQAGAEDFVIISGYYAASDTLKVEIVSPLGKKLEKALSNGTGCGSLAALDEGKIQLCHGKLSMVGESTTERELTVYITDQNVNANSPPKAGTWTLNLTGVTVTSTSGVDLWMLSDLGTNKAAAFTSNVEDFETVGIPGTAREAITVGAYATRLCWTDYNGNSQSYEALNPAINQSNHDIAYFSGIGPTRDSRFKPDIAAPGFGIVSALAHEVQAGMISSGNGLFLVNDDYQVQQGTSQAAPLVTGAVALLFEAEPGLTGAQVKSKLQNAARQDAYTRATAGFLGLNVYFGAGKLDLGSWAYSDPNETNDTLSQATYALSGQPFTGYVDRPADVDLFDLQGVKTGDTLNISLTNPGKDYALSLQGTLSIFFGPCSTASLSSVATSNQPGGANESISYVLGGGISTVGTPRYVRVTSSAGDFDEAQPYQLKAVITRPEQSAAHGTPATAQALPDFKEIKVTGLVNNGLEKDIYSLVINNLAALTVTGPSGAGTFLEILDKNGAVVASSSNGTVSYTTSGGLFGTQTLYVQVRGQLFSYTLTLKKP